MEEAGTALGFPSLRAACFLLPSPSAPSPELGHLQRSPCLGSDEGGLGGFAPADLAETTLGLLAPEAGVFQRSTSWLQRTFLPFYPAGFDGEGG